MTMVTFQSEALRACRKITVSHAQRGGKKFPRPHLFEMHHAPSFASQLFSAFLPVARLLPVLRRPFKLHHLQFGPASFFRTPETIRVPVLPERKQDSSKHELVAFRAGDRARFRARVVVVGVVGILRRRGKRGHDRRRVVQAMRRMGRVKARM